MNRLKELPTMGLAVIIVILLLFAAAVVMLCAVCARYRRLSRMIEDGDADGDELLISVKKEFAAVYKTSGEQTNTPGVIENVLASRMHGMLFCERFLNNAVSLFVTLGLFGTFLGLSMSVTSLTQLISYSNTSEWLSVLDSVGGGLMSALSGMGVAFYTSLVGAGCSILLTVLRTVFSPQSGREGLCNRLELWLDHTLAPTLPTEAVKDEVDMMGKMIAAMGAAAKAMNTAMENSAKTMDTAMVNAAKAMDASLGNTVKTMDTAMVSASDNMKKTMESSKPYLAAFHQTVEKFNKGVHDFSEVDYNLRGSVERMDLAVRELTGGLRKLEKGEEQ